MPGLRKWGFRSCQCRGCNEQLWGLDHRAVTIGLQIALTQELSDPMGSRLMATGTRCDILHGMCCFPDSTNQKIIKIMKHHEQICFEMIEIQKLIQLQNLSNFSWNWTHFYNFLSNCLIFIRKETSFFPIFDLNVIKWKNWLFLNST